MFFLANMYILNQSSQKVFLACLLRIMSERVSKQFGSNCFTRLSQSPFLLKKTTWGKSTVLHDVNFFSYLFSKKAMN